MEGDLKRNETVSPIGGLKVVAENGWFAARPSGTENIYKIYAESFKDQGHLDAIVKRSSRDRERSLKSFDSSLSATGGALVSDDSRPMAPFPPELPRLGFASALYVVAVTVRDWRCGAGCGQVDR